MDHPFLTKYGETLFDEITAAIAPVIDGKPPAVVAEAIAAVMVATMFKCASTGDPTEQLRLVKRMGDITTSMMMPGGKR